MSTPRDYAPSAPAPGSPGWWEAQDHSAPEARRGRPRRSFETIVETAYELVNEVGAGEFNMRLLANRLATSPTTLYRHAAGKDELLAHVVDRFFAALRQLAPTPRLPWQPVLRHGAIRFYDLLGTRPNLLPLLAAQVPVGPNALAVRETALSTLVAGGLSIELAARSYTTIAHYVIGFAIQQPACDTAGHDHAPTIAEYYHRLDPAHYPATIAAAASLTATSLVDEFREGLDFIIGGIAQIAG